MRQRPGRQRGQEDTALATGAELRFTTLVYRFLFFGWLFADMAAAKNPSERHRAWQHNRRMRRYLPIYLRRWSVLAALAFGLGHLFNRMLETSVLAAVFFIGASVTLTGMVIIAVLWVFLSNARMP